MQQFTGWQYLLIDAANQFGHDKLVYEERLKWAEENLDNLEDLARGKDWKEKPQYLKACMAIRKAQRGEPSGHLVGFDAICSGMQIMSVLTGCIDGARATGLIDPDRRADAYTECSAIMSEILGFTVENQRSKIKTAVMTSLYGSRKEPENLFGEDTDELAAFKQAMFKLAPGAVELLGILLESWDPNTYAHTWQLPDGFDSVIKVMQTVEKRIEVDELYHSSFIFQYEENLPAPKGVSNAANMVHSVDAYVLRQMIRRCSMDRDLVRFMRDLMTAELLDRHLNGWNQPAVLGENHQRLMLMVEAEMPDPLAFELMDAYSARSVPTTLLKKLVNLADSMLDHPAFPMMAVHDEFKCHPNNLNHLRKHYNNTLADLAESETLTFILRRLMKTTGTVTKLGDIAGYIRNANYALS